MSAVDSSRQLELLPQLRNLASLRTPTGARHARGMPYGKAVHAVMADVDVCCSQPQVGSCPLGGVADGRALRLGMDQAIALLLSCNVLPSPTRRAAA